MGLFSKLFTKSDSEARPEEKARQRMKEMAEARDQKCTRCGKEDDFLAPIGLKDKASGRIVVHNLCSACFSELGQDLRKKG